MAPNNGNIKCRSKSSTLAATLVVIDPKQNDTVRSKSRRFCSSNCSFAARPAKPKVDDIKVKSRKETRMTIVLYRLSVTHPPPLTAIQHRMTVVNEREMRWARNIWAVSSKPTSIEKLVQRWCMVSRVAINNNKNDNNFN